MDDPYLIPEEPDTYSALFWMDFRDQHVAGARFDAAQSTLYPYLAWAEAHFYNEAPPLQLLSTRYPFTWEGAGSEAYYAGIQKLSPELALQRFCAPHTWHAAEAWLYLVEEIAR